MRKRIPILLTTMIASALYSHQGLAADLTSQCMLGVSSYDRPLVQGEASELPVTINIDGVKGNYPGDVVFIGNADIAQGNSRLQADEVQLHQKQTKGQPKPIRTVDALGNIHHDDNQVILKGPKGWSNLNTKNTNIWGDDYQMVGRQGRGKVDLMKQHGENRYTILENGSFTSCLPGSDTWSVVGGEVIHDREEQIAEIWNARSKLDPVPVFYSPYLQLPVGDKRRFGFLILNAKHSTNSYFGFYLPYYWNIASSMDAAITPYYMHRCSGIMWENEFRYLTQASADLMEFDYPNPDKVYEDEHPNDNNSCRWLFYWQHAGVMDQVWRFNVDCTKVSNISYFNDFDNKYGSSADDYVTQKFSVGYAIQNFDAVVSIKQFQVFDAQNSNSYSAQPQLDANYYQSDVGSFDTRIYGQAVHFVNTNDNMPEAMRVHPEPAINLPSLNNWDSINTETKLLATHYQQINLDWYNNSPSNVSKLDESANRVTLQSKTDGRMVFERDIQMLAPGYIQTPKPRAQYLYVSYHDQSRIYNYDSPLLQSDHSGLFRDRTYGGLNRIVSANQAATGVTSRVYDDAAVKCLNISAGQICYFTEFRTGDSNIKWENDDKTGSPVWAGDTYWYISDRWGLRSRTQYGTRPDSVATSSSSIEYRRDENRMLQLDYRYASPEHIQTTLLFHYSTAEQYKNGISQVGAVASFPTADRWSIVGAYYFDINVSKEADSMLGSQYNSCCYVVRFGYERRLNGWDDKMQHAIYDNTIGFNIELRGLSSNHGLGTTQMLRSNVLPY